MWILLHLLSLECHKCNIPCKLLPLLYLIFLIFWPVQMMLLHRVDTIYPIGLTCVLPPVGSWCPSWLLLSLPMLFFPSFPCSNLVLLCLSGFEMFVEFIQVKLLFLTSYSYILLGCWICVHPSCAEVYLVCCHWEILLQSWHIEQ